MNDHLIPATPFNAKDLDYERCMIASQVSDELEKGGISERTMDRIRALVNQILAARAIESARMSSYEGN